MMPPSIWDGARKGGRDYVTPEDIQDAINRSLDSSGRLIAIQAEVLLALSKRQCEDWSLCASVAYKCEDRRP
jgi:hypothetical protein